MENWRQSLKQSRERQGLSRVELARRSSLSVDTIRAYEQGRRRPSEASLTAILDALKLDRTEANNIRLALGLAPDRRDFGRPASPTSSRSRSWPWSWSACPGPPSPRTS